MARSAMGKFEEILGIYLVIYLFLCIDDLINCVGGGCGGDSGEVVVVVSDRMICAFQ